MPRYYYLYEGNTISLKITLATNTEISVNSVTFKRLQEPPVIPTAYPPGYGIGGTIEAYQVKDESVVYDSENQCLKSCDDGDWVCFPNVSHYGDHRYLPVDTFIANVAVTDENAGKTVEVRLDSLDGELLGTLTLGSTGGRAPAFKDQFTKLLPCCTGSTSNHDYYFVFKGGLDIGDFRSFKLYNSQYPDRLPLMYIKTAPYKTALVKGDLNGDRAVNSTDRVLFKRIILKIITDLPIDNPGWTMDLNGDGIINSTDIVVLTRIILGMRSNR
ncbi:MAG: dockerin type I domain-containing protein [Bacillota bacterium]